MTPRPPRGEPTSPDDVPIQSGGSVDRAYDIAIKLGSIEQSITYLEGSSSDTTHKIDALGTKIEGLTREITEARAKFDVILPLVRNIGRVMWAIGGALGVFLLSLATLWIKHHYGW